MGVASKSFSRMFVALAVCAAPSVQAAGPLVLHTPVRDKNFYALSALEADPRVASAMAADKTLEGIAAERREILAAASQTCKADVVCTLAPLVWTEEEIRMVSSSLRRIYQKDAAVRAWVEKQLRPSGAYILFQKRSGADLLVSAWETCARGLNEIVTVYGQGLPPRYPLIDAISFDPHAEPFQREIASLVAAVSEPSPSSLFFEPSLQAALKLLALNHRDEAGRLEPLEAGANQAAVQAIRSTHWERFPYTVIVVPGAGGSDLVTPLSEAGRRRTALAAEAYHAGKAPFLLVSGGYVHPARTPFAEAMEMKNALLKEFHVPEAAILVDPHARHTTTNMRNAAREMERYGMPMNKPALVVSDAAQIGYIASQPFANRCLRELGYLPYRIAGQPSETSLVFLPSADSLQQDPLDPLDP